ncbi:hypothetical protein KY285_020740 [Solanum tuberosum]|nr:hypothetical protein KY285_020740 [Solanum tuberosum]
MIVNVALSSSTINSPATFPINRRLNVAGLPNPFLLHYRKINGSMFPSFLCRKITGGGRIVAAADMDKAEKMTGPVRIVGIVGEGSVSPLKSIPWLDVMLHTILNCLLDPNCRKALQCFNNCSPVDQVCNYRCIASYESKYLEEFSLCVLQKNNCLELDAKIPEKPYVTPMAEF